MDCKFKFTHLAICIAMLGTSISSLAHDTNTTHPRITHIIGESILVFNPPMPRLTALYKEQKNETLIFNALHFGVGRVHKLDG